MHSRRSGVWRWLPLVALALVASLVGGAAEPANDFRFSIVGDRCGGHVPGVYERVWREIGLLGPDFAINVGDSIEGYLGDGPNMPAAAKAQWAEFRHLLEPYRDIPFHLVPGNHDIWADAAEPIWRECAERAPYYAFRHQGALFVELDNSRVTELPEAQYEFLRRTLQEHVGAQPKFVFFHKPFWLAYANAGDKSHPFHRLCREYGVTNVVSGHGHQLLHLPFDGVDYLEVGTSGGTIGKRPAGEPKTAAAAGR